MRRQGLCPGPQAPIQILGRDRVGGLGFKVSKRPERVVLEAALLKALRQLVHSAERTFWSVTSLFGRPKLGKHWVR